MPQSRRAVHQLVITIEYGDAISSAVLRTQQHLRALGFRSDIFTDHVHPGLGLTVNATESLSTSLTVGDAVMYHLAIGSPLADLFTGLSATRVLVYHNVTPPEFFLDASPEVARWLAVGADDLARIAPVADLVIADSTFNLRGAVTAGARNAVVVPPPVDLGRLQPRPASGSAPPVILFVGRIAPNKRQDVLLRALAVLQETTDLSPTLALIGTASGAGAPAYLDQLHELVASLELQQHVVLDGRRLSDAQIGDWYARADCFAVASEHEGFCVPAVEAMAFGLPVVAYAAGAVPETVGDAAILLHSHDPLMWAAMLEELLRNAPLRQELRHRALRRVAAFSDDAVRSRLAEALTATRITP